MAKQIVIQYSTPEIMEKRKMLTINSMRDFKVRILIVEVRQEIYIVWFHFRRILGHEN